MASLSDLSPAPRYGRALDDALRGAWTVGEVEVRGDKVVMSFGIRWRSVAGIRLWIECYRAVQRRILRDERGRPSSQWALKTRLRAWWLFVAGYPGWRQR